MYPWFHFLTEESGSRGLLSDMLRSSAEPTIVENSMTGVLWPMRTIGEAMQVTPLTSIPAGKDTQLFISGLNHA